MKIKEKGPSLFYNIQHPTLTPPASSKYLSSLFERAENIS